MPIRPVSLLIVVDDDPVTRRVDAAATARGYRVDHATSLDDLKTALTRAPFDAALVDLFMPEVDGLKIIKMFRQRAPSLPIIAMSGFRLRHSMGPSLDFFGMATALGATSCLRKPFEPRQLMAAINLY